MAPINENEQVEFDGLRRRRTILAPGEFPSSPGLNRRKTIHPPLGMSHFPTEDEAVEDEDMHPGIFHLRRKRDRSSTNTTNTTTADPSMPLSPMKVAGISSVEGTDPSHHQQQEGPQPQNYGLPPSIHQDTAYKGTPQHIQFADSARPSSPPPPPPPHKDSSKRQFSFPFQLSSANAPSVSGPSAPRPVSRGALSFASRRSTSRATRDGTTEEERLGLVKGDSATGYGFSGGVSPEGSSDGEGEVERERSGQRKESPPRLRVEVGGLADGERLPSAKRLGDSPWKGDSG
jgi:magnesium transporter